MSNQELWRDTTHLCPKPLDLAFYQALVADQEHWQPRSTTALADFDGLAVELAAGELLRLQLRDGAQIVHCYPLNPADPDERYWAQHTVTTEGLFLTRYGRLWGSMARHRPMLTFLEDTVTPPRRDGAIAGRHHPCFSGTSTPAFWRAAGGAPDIPSGWHQMATLVEQRGWDPLSVLDKEDACLFQKGRIDEYTQHLLLLPSDALTGDRVTLFAEFDLVVLLALSPFVDGSAPAATLRPRPVDVTVCARVAEPPGWPYPNTGYPDLDLYLDENGVRSNEPIPTAGRES